MIQDELSVAFRWYDDLDKQARYRSACGATCDFKLIAPSGNRFLPFQIKSPWFSVIDTWEIYDLNGNLVLDISSKASTVRKFSVEGIRYLIGGGDDFETGAAVDIECGCYYSIITDRSGRQLFSEVFKVVDIDEPTYGAQMTDLPLPWKWYDNLYKQTRHKDFCHATCEYFLPSPEDALPPFQFIVPGSFGAATSWKLYCLDQTYSITLDTNKLRRGITADDTYVIYLGESLTNLECGVFYSEISDGTRTFYSEPIEVIDGLSSPAFMLQEDGARILQENTQGILLE